MQKYSTSKTIRLLPLIAIVLVVGCAPTFKKFKQVPAAQSGFLQHRVQSNGNAVLESQLLLDTLLYDRKLNGGIAAQVVGNSEFIIVPTYNKRLYFLNPANGEEKTSLVAESALGSAAALAGELLYYAEESGGDMLTCFNLINAKKSWSLALRDPQSAPILSGDELFICARDGKVYSVNRWTGAVNWTYESHNQIYASPAADSSIVVFGTDHGDIVALNRTNGQKLWSFHAAGSIFAQALVTDRVYCAAGDGAMYALDHSTGELIWKFETTAAIHTTPVQVDNRLLFGGDDKMVHCLNSNDGGVLWTYATNGIIQSSPIALGSTFVVANSAGNIYQFNLEGSPLKQFSIRQSIEATPALIDGKLFVVTAQRRIFAFSTIPATATSP